MIQYNDIKMDFESACQMQMYTKMGYQKERHRERKLPERGTLGLN